MRNEGMRGKEIDQEKGIMRWELEYGNRKF